MLRRARLRLADFSERESGAAVEAAVERVRVLIFRHHVRKCVSDAIKRGGPDKKPLPRQVHRRWCRSLHYVYCTATLEEEAGAHVHGPAHRLPGLTGHALAPAWEMFRSV